MNVIIQTLYPQKQDINIQDWSTDWTASVVGFFCVCVFLEVNAYKFYLSYSAFRALTLLVGRQEGHLACKN